ncbi:S8 family peptidase [Streptomyces sp. T-3]|nr:S8 family peptidase [Streptomyces sp. T-3]
MAATAVALLATGLTPAGAEPGPGVRGRSAPGTAPGTAPGAHTVTLLSGDRVTYTGSGKSLQVSGVRPGKGREGVAFTRARLDDHEYVIPVDATDALAAGRVDRQLFDVTALAAQGHDDARRTTVPLIATEQAELQGAARKGEFEELGLTARTVRKSEAAEVWQDLVKETAGGSRTARATKVWLDGKVEASLDKSVPLTGAPQAWKRGLDGKGVRVAVLDTGADTTHPDLKDRVVAEKNFTWDETAEDLNGHGTHVASTVAGGGQASGGRYKGVAPGAELLNGKVLDGGGSGYISWILEGMEWAAAQKADIVSMSLGSGEPSDGSDPLSQAVERLTAGGGPLFVVAAGNEGRPNTIGSPSAAPSALTVGSITKQRAMSGFSSQGPALTDGGVKPEITAPGSDITAARAKGTFESVAVSEHYASISGTSMATPHVSGAAAILKQRHPDWNAQQLKSALVGSADAVDDAGVYEQGAGSVDVPGALHARVQATPAAVSAELTWPYAKEVTREVTYRNTGDKSVRLSLEIDGYARVALGERRLTIPAGGTATTTVRIDGSATGPGTHSAWITARGSDGSRVRTPVGIDAEARSATLTLAAPAKRPGVDRAYTNVVVQNERTGESQLTGVTEGTRELRLPEGTYRLLGSVWEYDDEGPVAVSLSTVQLAERVTLSGDRTVTPDLSGAEPVTLGVDDPTMRINSQGSAQGLVSQVAGAPTGLLTPLFDGQFEAYAVGSGRIPGVTYFAGASWEQPFLHAATKGPDPVDIPVDPYYFARIEWDIEGQVVDVGDGADLAGRELADRIVLFEPGHGAPGDEVERRYRAILAQKPQVVLLGRGWVSAEPDDQILVVQEPAQTLLRKRLAAGPVTLEIKAQRNGERAYFTFHAHENGVPAGADWVDRKADLARVEHSVRTTGYPNDVKGLYGWARYAGLDLVQQNTVVRAPHKLTAYYTPDVPWTAATFEYAVSERDQEIALGEQFTEPTVYRRGRTVRENWLTGPFNPSLSVPGSDGRAQATRDGDKVRLSMPMLSDAGGHRSSAVPSLESGTTELRTASGELVGRNDSGGRGVFDVPARSGSYELTSTVRRESSSWELGTQVSDTWRFRSGRTSSERALGLLDTRYDMAGLDGDNSVGVSRPLEFGVGFGYQSGAKGSAVNQVRVSYSVDDGLTWRAADVRARGGSWRVTVPGSAQGWVSLKVTGSAPGGASLTETVTRAYKVGCPSDWCGYAPEWPRWK